MHFKKNNKKKNKQAQIILKYAFYATSIKVRTLLQIHTAC